MKFVFFSLNEMEEFWEDKFPGLISEKAYVSVNDGNEYALFMISFDFLDQYQQFMDEVLKLGYSIKIIPADSCDKILSTVGESAPLMYINNESMEIEVM